MVAMQEIRFQMFSWLLHNWSLDFNVDEDKDPVGDGEGGVDDGDEEEADVLDLLLHLALPHALHQLGHLQQHYNVLLEMVLLC